ncbi:MAG: hypothetical protein ABEJ70_00125 [Halobacteriaceae archaeon]
MSHGDPDHDRVRAALREADPEGPLTAREVLALCREHGVELGSAHRVATVLGRWAESGDAVTVIRSDPYRYEFDL